jgi:TetR/AcrR family transcriptional regulator, mexCD-oprJ operon repressor
MTTTSVRSRGDHKRADARKNIDAIIEAAIVCLARDPDVSMGEIAKVAGVGRVTLYAHFENRAVLLSEVVAVAMAQTDADLEELDLGGDPREAMARLIEAIWRLTHRFGALVVAAEQALPPDRLRAAHVRPARRVRRLVQRGRREGTFRSDMPVDWMISVMHSVIHEASNAVHRGEITARAAQRLARDTILAAYTLPDQVPRD